MDKLTEIESAWTGHRDFAHWLVNKLQPKITVELGVDYGYSLFTLAENNPGLVIGVDLFEGDEHTGLRGADQAAKVEQFAVDHGYSNVKLIKGSFDNVAKQWNSSIDLLHIDGLHTYAACLNDFKRWAPFVSAPNGVVIMHDITSYLDVCRVFVEIAAYKVAFLHSGGLGIICRNPVLVETILAEFPNSVSGDALAAELEKQGVFKPSQLTV